ncbi:hypothetical protein POM88_018065 [Heracleum sosnowskyi]|uniref:Replication protein A subunit n=1 Tax=Heracleum sosnowskyi TaxID=360622 RepID=A0AAD8IPU9_9APIA|nr:hypothetical protein POM88_018065 [Heracleum sosnowskyi]
MKYPNTTLAAVTPDSDKDTIMVRVTRIWEAINKRNGAIIHTNVILLDEKENHMVAIIRNNQKQIYLPLLKEGEVYTISNFKVVPGPKQYKSVDSEYSINFFFKTKIEKGRDFAAIPMYKFELQPFTAVKTLVGNPTMLIDVVGMVRSYCNLERRNNGAQKMDLVLTDQRAENVLVTLWEDRATQFLDLLPPSKDGPLFVVITGLLAKKFSDSASLSSTDATRCYLNIDYAPITDLQNDMSATSNGKLAGLHPPTIEQFVTSTGDGVQELPISSILQTVIPPGTQVVRCICRAKILGILDGTGWYYNCCPTCARALGDLNGKFYCIGCDEEMPSLAQRFRIVVQVEDPTGSTTVTLFNKEAEQLVGVPLQKILADQAEHAQLTDIPSVVRNIIGKLCAFQIKITPYNIIQGCEEYTVTRVSEVGGDVNQATIVPNSVDTRSPIQDRVKRQKVI